MHKIKKAIIPLAGLATRIYPMNKVTKKGFLPIIDLDGRIKPIILKLLEELDEAEIEEIYLIIGKNDKPLYDELFEGVNEGVYKKLNIKDKEYEQKIIKIGKKIKYIIQEECLGFGHAVYLSKEYLQNEACILLLGDTIYKSKEKDSCVEQILKYYDEQENTIIALQELKEKDLKNYGTVYGFWDNKEKTKISLQKLIEKPSIEVARKELLMNGKFYGNFGEFVLTKDVFLELEKLMKISLQNNQEYQLMDALENVIKQGKVKGLMINGVSFDAGNIEAYKNVQRNF